LRELILANVPARFKDSISVTSFMNGKRAGIAVEFNDLAESFVYAGIEYQGGDRD